MASLGRSALFHDVPLGSSRRAVQPAAPAHPLTKRSSSLQCAPVPQQQLQQLRRCRVYNRAVQTAAASSQGTAPPGPQKVFFFDPSNPEEVQEVLVEPHVDIEAAEELLQEEAMSHQDGNGTNGTQSTTRQRRTPVPLRAFSPLAARKGTPTASRAMPAPTQNGDNSMALTQRNGNSAAIQKSAEMQKELVAQLEREHSQVIHLQQFEGMYREWRMRAERLEADLDVMQRAIAEKDAELAHGYRLLEASAAERSRLRHAYQTVQEKVKTLQHNEHMRALPEGASPAGLLPSGSDTATPGSNGHGRAKEASIQPAPMADSKVAVAIEELTQMARGIARDMAVEIKTIYKAAQITDAAQQ